MTNNNRQALFVWIPKTAGQSILAALRSADSSQDITDVQQQKFSPVCRFTTFHHHSIPALLQAGVISHDWLGSQYVFTFLRNPWDRLVSLFCYLQQAHPATLADREFSAFIEDTATVPPVGLYNVDGMSQANPQTAWLDIPLDFVGRFEHLRRDWQRLSRSLGIARALPHLNKSFHGDYRQYYTSADRDKVAEFYADEIERFAFQY